MISCNGEKTSDNHEYIAARRNEFIRQRVPALGSIELTHRCNLRCIHCYLDTPAEDHQELTTSQWLAIIDQIAAAGCLNLLITGGEPLLRHDFAEIYQHAKRKGMLVTIFTNGTLINEPILELFGDLPPYAIEITLYGASQKTYESITRVPGSFAKCMQGVRNIKKTNLRLNLKTILMKTNQHELAEIRAVAHELDVGFRLDSAIFPRMDGDPAPIKLRVPPPEAVSIEFADPQRLLEWQEFFHQMQDTPEEDKLFTCGAGLTTFHVDSTGNLSPCLMVRDPAYNLLQGSFNKGWNEIISQIRKIKVGEKYLCNQCEKRFICNLCPGFSLLDQGSLEKMSPYLCSLGEERHKMLVTEYIK